MAISTWRPAGFFVAGLMLACSAQAANAQIKPLTTDDIAQIKQLTAKYAHLVDRCQNGGKDYAALFTEDGTFGVSDAWDVDGTVWARGTAALQRAGGGTADGGCRESKPGTPGYGLHHIVTSEVVEAAPGGAVGKSVLITMGVDGTPGSIEWQGGYQDRYVKTEKGWRIQSRWHVWPGYKDSLQLKTHPLPPALLPPQRAQ